MAAGPRHGTGRATPGGAYDATLGGRDNFPADRALAAELLGICPELGRIAESNRLWLQAATLLAVSHLEIAQFLDLGCGYPAPGGVLEGVLNASDETRIGCVDCDEDIAGRYGYQAVLDEKGETRAKMVLADLTRPEGVTGHPGLRNLIDFGRPAFLVFGAVLHYWPAAEGRRIIAGYMDRIPAGSAVAVTVVASPDQAKHEAMRAAWRTTGTDFVNLHSDDDSVVATLFEGLDLLRPGAGPVAGVRRAGAPCVKSYLSGGIAVKRLTAARSLQRQPRHRDPRDRHRLGVAAPVRDRYHPAPGGRPRLHGHRDDLGLPGRQDAPGLAEGDAGRC